MTGRCRTGADTPPVLLSKPLSELTQEQRQAAIEAGALTAEEWAEREKAK